MHFLSSEHMVYAVTSKAKNLHPIMEQWFHSIRLHLCPMKVKIIFIYDFNFYIGFYHVFPISENYYSTAKRPELRNKTKINTYNIMIPNRQIETASFIYFDCIRSSNSCAKTGNIVLTLAPFEFLDWITEETHYR